MSSLPPSAPETTGKSAQKLPRPVFETIFAFPPNRETMGGTAYFIQESCGNILVDCPAWDDLYREFLQRQGGVRWLFLTHRGAIAHAREFQQSFNCEIVVQEQEAYLLPNLQLTTFQHELQLSPQSRAIWTPGHSPGSACLYHSNDGGVLFSGRHLLPNAQGEPTPLRISKTFHWRRQIQSIQKLLDQFSSETLGFICPGANTGFLRGERSISQAYDRLAQLDQDALLSVKPLL